MTLEHIEVELKDIGTHMERIKVELQDWGTHLSENDRRVRALETSVAALEASRLEDSTDGTGAAETSRPAAMVFKKPEEAVEYAAEISLTEVADLKRELAEARKVTASHKRIVDERTNERDEALKKLEKITDAIQEAKLDDTLVSGGSMIHYIETAIGE